MRISVVTPSFNMAAYLEETIVSVIGNLAPGDEYFIVDGGSTDGSVDIIRKYEDRITGWVSEPDNGYADAIGKGFDRASGDVLCWLNAGDLYLAGAFGNARRHLGDSDMIFGDDFYVDDKSRVIFFSRGWVGDLRSAMLLGAWSPLQEACFWRRSLYERIGGIDRSLKLAADFDLFLRMALAGKASYVPITFSAFRQHSGQKSVASAAAYRVERERCRSRERARYGSAGFANLPARLWWRLAMNIRGRFASRIWRQPAVAGQSISALRSGAYYPSIVR